MGRNCFVSLAMTEWRNWTPPIPSQKDFSRGSLFHPGVLQIDRPCALFVGAVSIGEDELRSFGVAHVHQSMDLPLWGKDDMVFRNDVFFLLLANEDLDGSLPNKKSCIAVSVVMALIPGPWRDN